MMIAQDAVNTETDRLQMPPLDLRTPIEPRPQGCAVPLTAEQLDFFTSYTRADPEQRPLSVRMCVSATRVTGPLSFILLERSIADLMRRHESLRTTFKTFAEVTVHHVDPPSDYWLPCVDLSAFCKIEAEGVAKRLITEFQGEKIDISIGPLFEARLFKLATREHILIVLADHMISDGISNALLDKEIWQAYDEALGDEPASLPTPPVQFADYVVWRERTKESWKAEHEEYWRQHQTAGEPTIIPVTSETDEHPEIGSMAHISLGSGLTVQLRQLADRHRISLSNVMLMVYATAMSFWCDREDLVIRCPVHGRHGRRELEGVIGFFSSYVCLRIRVDRQRTLLDLLVHVQSEIRSALAHRDFGKMRELMPESKTTELEFHWRSASRRGRAAQKWLHPSQTVKRQPFLIRSPTLNANFRCIFNEVPADVCVTARYRPHLFRTNVVEQFGNDMRSVAKALIDRPLDPIDRMDLRADATHDAS